MVIFLILSAILLDEPGPAPASQKTTAAVDRLMTGIPMTYLHAIGRDIVRELKLDADETARVADVVERHQPGLTEERRMLREIRGKLRELVEARRAGEAKRVTALEAEVDQLRAERTARFAGHDPQEAFYDDVAKALPAVHQAELAAFKETAIERRQLGERFRKLIADLPQTLALDAAQKGRYEELREQLRAKLPRGGWTIAEPDEREVELMNPELGANPEADAEAVTRVAKGKLDTRGLLLDFLDGLEPTLNEKQKATLADLRDEAFEHGQFGFASARTLFRAVKRLEGLTGEQEGQLRDLERETMKKVRDAGRAGPQPAIAEEAKSRILAVLTSEQAAEFRKMISHGARKGGE